MCSLAHDPTKSPAWNLTISSPTRLHFATALNGLAKNLASTFSIAPVEYLRRPASLDTLEITWQKAHFGDHCADEVLLEWNGQEPP